MTQYDVILVALDPNIGSEINKTRPCVVLSPDEMNQHLRTIIIAPLTSSKKDYPSRVPINHNKSGFIVLDQTKTIDKSRIVRTLGTMNHRDIKEIKLTIKEMLVD